VFACASRAQSPAGLQGTVTDPVGSAVAEAVVRLESRDGSTKRFTTTGGLGEYQFETLVPGEYLLTVEAPDFAHAVIESVHVGGDAPGRVDVRLALAGLRTEVMVTASGTPLRVEEISKALDTVGAQEMDRRGELFLSEAVRHMAGLQVQQQQGPGGLVTIQMRGLRSTDTAVLVDGFRLRDAADTQGSASPFLQDLMIVDTERVEVLRGSGSSLYGSHALGGVVNIVTDSGGGRPHGEVRAEGGGLGALRGLARAGGGALQDRLLYSGGLSHLNVRHGVDGFDDYRNSSAHGSLLYHFTPAASLSGRIFTADSFRLLNDSPSVLTELEGNLPATGPIRGVALPRSQQLLAEAGQPFAAGNATFMPDANDPDNQRGSFFFNGLLTFTHRLSPAASYRIAYQGVKTRREFSDGPGGIIFEPEFNNVSRFDGRIDVVQARADVDAGPQLFSLGYEFERETYDSPSSDENPDPAQRVNTSNGIKQRSHTLFAQDQIRLIDGRLQLSLSGRVQSFRLSEPEFSGGPSPYEGIAFETPPSAYTGDASLSYFIANSGTKLRAHAGNAYRASSLFERFGSSFFFGSFSPFGDPRLRPERSVGLDTGIDQYLFDDRLRLSATYFYTRLQETIFFDFSGVIEPGTDPFGRFGGYRNVGGGIARGLETSVSANPISSLHLTASYTHTNADQATSSAAGGDFFKQYGISDHVFTLTALQRIGRRADVAFDFFAASEYPTPFFTNSGSRVFLFDGTVKADLSAGYTFPLSDRKSLRLHGKIENVFDKTNFEDGFRSPGILGTVGLSVQF